MDWKHVDDIVRAVGMLASAGRNVTLDIYGTGPDEARLRKIAARSGAGVVRFHPPVKIAEVRERMRGHDVYALASDAFEGWGAVVCEALEEGMSVVGTRDSGAAATILPEERLCDAEDAKGLAALIAKAAEGALPPVGIGEWSLENGARRLMELAHDAMEGRL